MHVSIENDQQLRELALSVARNELGANDPIAEVLQRECVTTSEYDALLRNALYIRTLREFKEELTENGFSFSAKCRILAEDLIGDVYRMAKNADTPAAMRVKTLENLVEWGLLKPKVAVAESNSNGYSITINLGNSPSTGKLVLENVISAPKTTIMSLPSAPLKPLRPLLDLAMFLDDPWDEPYYEAEATACP